MSKTNKFIITGTGRCGTQYVSSVLTICGVKCGHQSVDYDGNIEKQLRTVDGDSSYKAVWHLPKLRKMGYTIIGLYRSPDKVIRSILELGQTLNFLPVDFPYTPEGDGNIYALSKYYYMANIRIEKYAHSMYETDSIDLKQLFEDIGFGGEYDDNLVNAIPDNANSRDKQKTRTVELELRDLDPVTVDTYIGIRGVHDRRLF